jgi:predicted flap endonuclease-1-like 5' DNA nuclease
MTKCTCCGQQIESQASDALFAQELLLDCCDHAAAIALSEGSSEIEIAHLAIALAQLPMAQQVLERFGIDGRALEHAAALQLSSSARFEHRIAPEPSAEYLEVLRRAETAMLQTGGDTVTLERLVEILLHHSADLAGAAFLNGSVLRAVAAQTEREYEISRQQVDHGYFRGAGIGEMAETASTFESDPFQLNANLPVNEEATPAYEPTTLFGHHVAFEGRERTMDGANEMSIALRGVEQQLWEMKELLGKLSAQVQSFEAGRSRASANSDTAAGGIKNASMNSSNAGRAHRYGLTSQDLERIENIVAGLDRADAVNGQSSNSNPSSTTNRARRHSIGSQYRRWKSRNRAARGSRRSVKRNGFFEQARTQSDSSQKNDIEVRGPSSLSSIRPDYGEERHSGNQHKAETEDDGDLATKRFYLAIDDAIVCAPSIGERTAARLTPHGIARVRDLLAADAADLAEAINARHITARRVEDWQMQARLMCTIPWLWGTHAQLLVGAGYTTPGDICEATGDVLSADILQFASTRDGQRILRSGQPPELEKILKWAEHAALAELDRAA